MRGRRPSGGFGLLGDGDGSVCLFSIKIAYPLVNFASITLLKFIRSRLSVLSVSYLFGRMFVSYKGLKHY